ncbi:cation:proton antiporter domain-containing protein [Spirochaeta lutea]|uniref:Cation/H+ exchanger transmembrane domain-containing protein n=1 Tax=Spirochaeta lutea TaxID=1480694 RepID=A0A098QWX2_9SPIO|nr:cation:proton antiporter [Spirochaeta lutea]KGE71893.1 hypothetical protein DC28_08735 [Spirochaeta lutea]
MGFEVLFFLIFAGGWVMGRLAERFRLPGVLGMTIWGIVLALIPSLLAGGSADMGAAAPSVGSGSGFWPSGFWETAPFLKSLALVVILLRAGLGISKSDLSRAGTAALLMAFIPCLFEGAVLTLLFHGLMGFPWMVAGLTAFMLAAVSPAVVVPSMLELQDRGLGRQNGVITTVLAGASVDDVVVITLFTLFLNLAVSPEQTRIGLTLVSIPLSLLGGIALGAVIGLVLAWWFRSHHASIRATEKALLLLASSVFLLQVGDWVHLAALLGVMTIGFVLLERAEPQARELAGKLGKVWVPAQIALFVIIGLSIDVQTAFEVGPVALLIILTGLLARSVGVVFATLPSSMNWKERLFCVIAYTPKATVQAALGGAALSAGLPQGKIILAVAVLAIVITAPLGLIGIRGSAKRLLASEL